MVIPVAAINIPANTKIASLTRARRWLQLTLEAITRVDVERESDIREETRWLQHSVRNTRRARKRPSEYSKIRQGGRTWRVTGILHIFNAGLLFLSAADR